MPALGDGFRRGHRAARGDGDAAGGEQERPGRRQRGHGLVRVPGARAGVRRVVGRDRSNERAFFGC